MTKKGRSTQSAVEKLVEQRRLIHDWLAKLRANVDGMPENVIDRVRKDYRTRLDTVMAELSSHRDTLRETLEEAKERQEDLEQVQQRRKDELAELKLRRQVGEMDDPKFKEEQSEMQGAIDQIKKDLANTIRDIERYEEILEVISAGEAPGKDDEEETDRRKPAPARTSSIMTTKDVDELAFLRSVTSVVGAVKLPPKPTAPPASPVPPATPAPPAPPPRPVGPPPRPVESAFDAAPGLVQIPVEPIPPAPPEPEPPAAPSTRAPTAAAMPSAASIPKGGSVAAETIKCKNCGAANKPTEWYCEKCGAEISAF